MNTVHTQRHRKDIYRRPRSLKWSPNLLCSAPTRRFVQLTTNYFGLFGGTESIIQSHFWVYINVNVLLSSGYSLPFTGFLLRREPQAGRLWVYTSPVTEVGLGPRMVE